MAENTRWEEGQLGEIAQSLNAFSCSAPAIAPERACLKLER
jgi:hypothetical protein